MSAGTRSGGRRAGSTRPRILVVDDDPDVRAAMTDILRGAGADVFLSDEGRKAIELMESWRPRLVLLDLSMPGMDGRAFRAEQVRRRELASIPVIVITASRDPGIPADGFLQKPFTREQLLEVASRFVPLAKPPA
jgi:CheY-like chemotaxis protein